MGSTTTAGTASKKAAVEITYKARDEHLAYHAHERVDDLLEQAIDRFDIEHGRHHLALFAADGHELPRHATLHDAGVRPGDHLVLRSRVIHVIYNGRTEDVPYDGAEVVSGLLEKVLTLFGVTSNRHLMSLFDEANHELDENGTVHQDKVEPGDRLVLRQSTVKGG
jgi:hypothetical protein